MMYFTHFHFYIQFLANRKFLQGQNSVRFFHSVYNTSFLVALGCYFIVLTHRAHVILRTILFLDVFGQLSFNVCVWTKSHSAIAQTLQGLASKYLALWYQMSFHSFCLEHLPLVPKRRRPVFT